jgi:hypothetical protein
VKESHEKLQLMSSFNSPQKLRDHDVSAVQSNYTVGRNNPNELHTMASFNCKTGGNTPLSEMKSYKNSESRKDFFHKPKNEPKVERHPSEIPHLHDAFTKARGHFNIDHLETDGGYKHGKFKNTRTFGQRTQTIDTE